MKPEDRSSDKACCNLKYVVSVSYTHLKALEYYYDLLALKEPPMRILYLLSRQFKLLLHVKELVKQGNDKHRLPSLRGCILLWRENI